MPRFVAMLTGSGEATTIRRKLVETFPKLEVSLEKVNPNPTKADRFAIACAKIEEAKSEIEAIKDEMIDWKDSLPENMQESEKASQIEEAAQALEDVLSCLEQVDPDQVEFPS